MAQTKKLFSLDERTVDLLNLLVTERGMTNTSELIRTLILEAAVAENITRDYGELPSTTERRKSKSDIASRLDKLEAAMAKLTYNVGDVKEIAYETRDGVNSYLNYLGVDNADSADDNVSPETIHKSLRQSKQNYNAMQRQRSIDKANFGGGK